MTIPVAMGVPDAKLAVKARGGESRIWKNAGLLFVVSAIALLD